MHFDSNEEKKFRDQFNRIMNDNQNRDSIWGYPIPETEHADDLEEEEYGEDSISRVHTDGELEMVIRELLHNSHRLDSRDITVGVHQGGVKLSGTVGSQKERDYAVGIVKLIHGVGEVKSELIVKTHDGILPTDIGRNP